MAALRASRELATSFHVSSVAMLLRTVVHLEFSLLSTIKKSATTRSFTSQKISDPLRILFCGSDNFSIASLKAVHEVYQREPESIASIDVVCRPGKRVGRGLKTVREVPIAQVARNLSLSLHEVDTFTGWIPPIPQGSPINLVIAVSFGRLVPPRILNGAKYGGLNLHPSMLPDFHGPAPMQHTLLNDCSRTGVTLQTMHPRHFDQGIILDQTPFPGFEHGCTTYPELSSKMGSLGANMLVETIENRIFVLPHEIKGWVQAGHEGHNRPAPKITSEDSHVDWGRWTADQILRRQTIVGPLWNLVDQLDSKNGENRRRRAIWSSGLSKGPTADLDLDQNPGQPYSTRDGHPSPLAQINTIDGHMLQAEKVTLDGERERSARAAFASLRVDQQKPQIQGDKLEMKSLCLE